MRRRGRLPATVEITPLIDIVFLLLIFFMVSSTFIRRNELEIDLPRAEGVMRHTEAAPVEITVHQDGRFTVNGQPAGMGAAPTLVDALTAARAAQPWPEGVRAVVAADALVPHEAVVQVMAAARKFGVTRISVLTRPPAAGNENEERKPWMSADLQP